MDNKKNKFLTVGTQECALLCGLLGLLIAVLLLTIGFWKTVMLVVFFLVGLFIGGVADKKACISDLIDRWFGKRAEKVQVVVHPKAEKAAAAAEAEAEENEAEEAETEEAEDEPEAADADEPAETSEETDVPEAEENAKEDEEAEV